MNVNDVYSTYNERQWRLFHVQLEQEFPNSEAQLQIVRVL